MEEGIVKQTIENNNVLNALEGLIPAEEIKQVAESISEGAKPGDTGANASGESGAGAEGGSGAQNQSTEGGEDGKGQGAEGGEAGGEGKEKTTGEEKKPTTEKQSRLGLKKPGQKQEIVIEKVEDVLGVVKSKYGQDLKDIKELPKFFESVDKMRVAAQKAETLEKENTTFRELWENVPLEVVEAVKLHVAGEDYMKAFDGRPKVDLSIPVEKQDIQKLVNEYFPGKFTEDDFKEEVKSPALEIAIQAAKDRFISQKKEFDSRRASVDAKAAEVVKRQEAAVSGSVENLKKSFPLVDDESLNEVSKMLKGGVNEVISFLFDEDGVARPEAAERLFMAKFGKEEIEVASEIAAHKAETAVNEEIVTRGADTKKPVQRTGVTQTLSKEAQKKIQELEQIAKQQGQTF